MSNNVSKARLLVSMDSQKIKTVSTPETLNSQIKAEILEEFDFKEENFHSSLQKENIGLYFPQKIEFKEESENISNCSDTQVELPYEELDIKEEMPDIDELESLNFSASNLEMKNSSTIPTDYEHSKRFMCIFCNKPYNYLSHLKKHMRTHSGEKPYTCEICCKNFRCKGTLKVHFLTHTGLKPFKCHICEKEFQTSSNLKKHSLIHTDEKPYMCDICHRKYRCITQMKNHRMQHLGEKKYHCSYCDEKFGHFASLKAHLLKHTGEMPPFKCDICNKSFKMSHHLKRHKETHVGAPFVCRKCNREFLQLRELQRHSSDCRSRSFERLDHR